MVRRAAKWTGRLPSAKKPGSRRPRLRDLTGNFRRRRRRATVCLPNPRDPVETADTGDVEHPQAGPGAVECGGEGVQDRFTVDEATL
jgi:hypothetical protein